MSTTTPALELEDDATDFDFDIGDDNRAEFDRLMSLGFDRAASASVAGAAPLTDVQGAIIRAAFAGVTL
jgi:Fe2+ transport system protein FeoA